MNASLTQIHADQIQRTHLERARRHRLAAIERKPKTGRGKRLRWRLRRGRPQVLGQPQGSPS